VRSHGNGAAGIFTDGENMAQPAAVPIDSILHSQLADAYFYDAYAVPSTNPASSILEIYLKAVARTPAWINFLMTTRNRIVGLFGLKNLGRMGDVVVSKQAADYRVGDRIGIFSILSLSDREMVLGDTDKHLTAKVSLHRSAGEHPMLTASTVVHVHNFLGRAYLFFVVPVHKVIAPAMLARLAGAKKAG
jgi:hypothetical protein